MRIDRALCAMAAVVLGLSTLHATAAPLEPQACASLKTEHATLVSAGVKADMDRGPSWAKANLAPERLQKIERLIVVEEQLSFRCGELLTARPALKEPPKPPEDAQAKKQAGAVVGLSGIPPPKRKNKDAAKAARKKQDAKP